MSLDKWFMMSGPWRLVEQLNLGGYGAPGSGSVSVPPGSGSHPGAQPPVPPSDRCSWHRTDVEGRGRPVGHDGRAN